MRHLCIELDTKIYLPEARRLIFNFEPATSAASL